MPIYRLRRTTIRLPHDPMSTSGSFLEVPYYDYCTTYIHIVLQHVILYSYDVMMSISWMLSCSRHIRSFRSLCCAVLCCVATSRSTERP